MTNIQTYKIQIYKYNLYKVKIQVKCSLDIAAVTPLSTMYLFYNTIERGKIHIKDI